MKNHGQGRIFHGFGWYKHMWYSKNQEPNDRCDRQNINLPHPPEFMNVLEGDLDCHAMWEPEFKLIHLTSRDQEISADLSTFVP